MNINFSNGSRLVTPDIEEFGNLESLFLYLDIVTKTGNWISVSKNYFNIAGKSRLF